ncbi:hypothetical protein GCK72_010424 [Caenorhabditis remanei]|uniref:Uncharacterized protein n=1 Tax=Caenorhabditis remanei TaxID=31234 RepID=A0A6A5H715_CAERE|nr:hypothetical protein GCK72_010424 [Caenorhabditis remanei]KAF1762162.1 hypothetical protein GCK72_010424 [Caenorhabditis remanei]
MHKQRLSTTIQQPGSTAGKGPGPSSQKVKIEISSIETKSLKNLVLKLKPDSEKSGVSDSEMSGREELSICEGGSAQEKRNHENGCHPQLTSQQCHQLTITSSTSNKPTKSKDTNGSQKTKTSKRSTSGMVYNYFPIMSIWKSSSFYPPSVASLAPSYYASDTTHRDTVTNSLGQAHYGTTTTPIQTTANVVSASPSPKHSLDAATHRKRMRQ